MPSATKTTQQHKTPLQQYSLQSILNLYDGNDKQKHIPQHSKKILIDIRSELTDAMKQSKQRIRKSERRRHGHPRREHTNTHQDNGISINRSVATKEDPFKCFQKKCNLILNSLIDTNADDVCQRLFTLFTRQNVIREILNKTTMDDIAKQYANHICQQIVDNASIQAIYSSVYVDVYKAFHTKLANEKHTVIHTYLQNQLLQIISDVDIETVSKMNGKGLAKLTTYLYLSQQTTRDWFLTCVRKWLSCLSKNETNICEVVVHVFLTIAESTAHKNEWEPFVQSTIQPLWEEGSSLGMRSRIRLWDIRDIYT